MNYTPEKFDQLTSLIARHTPQEGSNSSSLERVWYYKVSTPINKNPIIDQPAIWLVVQGRKTCYIGNQKYEFKAGDVVILFFPMALESEIVSVSPENPYLMASVFIDLGRLADVLLRLDRIDKAVPKPVISDPSGIFSVPLRDNLLEPFIRLFTVLNDPKEAAFLGEAIIDEIYFRLLNNERGCGLRYLLQQRGEIQRISKAVEYIHENVDQPISVESLAEMVHMGQTSFYENFKKIMHLSPLQYAKSVKLHHAQLLIREGKKANEAGYLVGYKSPAQFSREYKRHFGFAPSAT
ncbi:MAG: AraC family transcriptional regulator [Anaerolineales bacterium]|jgi:AraC-like DNA-binding protein